jgi:quinol monooxygenase YgiN
MDSAAVNVGNTTTSPRRGSLLRTSPMLKRLASSPADDMPTKGVHSGVGITCSLLFQRPLLCVRCEHSRSWVQNCTLRNLRVRCHVILSLIELIPIAGKRNEILQLLRFSVDHIKGKPGCLSSEVYEAGDQKQTILYLERWTSKEDLYRHIQSNLYLGILNATDLAVEPRGITFCDVSQVRSMDLIVTLRTCSTV